jgi:hypothetical protein
MLALCAPATTTPQYTDTDPGGFGDRGGRGGGRGAPRGGRGGGGRGAPRGGARGGRGGGKPGIKGGAKVIIVRSTHPSTLPLPH